jgi:hypothetical protein
MHKNKKINGWHKLLMTGLFSALLGFSYATATGNAFILPKVQESRALEKPGLSFITPLDLGDVLAGSMFFRQIVVDGGLPPHAFAFGAKTPSDSTITISESGMVSGTPAAEGVYDFDVQVSDKVGAATKELITGRFAVTAKAHSSGNVDLAFLDKETMPTALVGASYYYSFAANGGVPPYSFQLNSDADFNKLPAGLFFTQGDIVSGMDSDNSGVLFGKPASATTGGQPAMFDVRVTDGRGIALVKTFSLEVVAGQICSGFVALKGSFKLDFGRPEKDTLNLTLQLDKGLLRSFADIQGKEFSVMIGGKTLPPEVSVSGKAAESKFNAKGEIKFPDVNAGLLGSRDLPQYRVRFDPRTGVINMSFQRISLASAIGATRDFYRDPVLPIGVKIGNMERTDAVKFIYQRSGAIGAGQIQTKTATAPAGYFFISSLRGKEVQLTTESDGLVMRIQGHLRQPGGTTVLPATGDTVGIFLGSAAAFEIPTSALKITANQVRYLSNSPADAVKRFEINTANGTFLLETNPVSARDMGFEQAILTAGDPFQLPIGIWIVNTGTNVTTFNGQTSVVIYRRGNSLGTR